VHQVGYLKKSGVFCYRNKTERDVWITIQNNAHHLSGMYGISKAVQSAIDGFNSTALFRADPDADLFASVCVCCNKPIWNETRRNIFLVKERVFQPFSW
jgi:hypothetical protein